MSDAVSTTDATRATGAGAFMTTHWSVVLKAGRDSSPAAAAALSELCQAYWYPLYAYARRRGCAPEAAKDAVQEFFLKLTATRFFASAKREKGKFRSFLLTALKRFLINEWHRARRQKRGGEQPAVSLDECLAESRYRLDVADDESADVLFDRQWAMTLLDRVFVRLEKDYAAAGKQPLFNELRGTISRAEQQETAYADVAKRLKMSEGAVKVAVHRLRAKYREALRAEIAQTVAGPEQVEEEIRDLFAVFGG